MLRALQDLGFRQELRWLLEDPGVARFIVCNSGKDSTTCNLCPCSTILVHRYLPSGGGRPTRLKPLHPLPGVFWTVPASAIWFQALPHARHVPTLHLPAWVPLHHPLCGPQYPRFLMRTVGPGETKELAKITHLVSETRIQFDPKAQGLDSYGRGIIFTILGGSF